MTEAATLPIFTPEVTWLFLRPIALAGGIALAVNYLLWPENSVTNYMAVLKRTLANYNAYFKDHSQAFLSLSPSDMHATLPSLHAQLQGSVLLLIDCKRAVQREILYSNLSAKDISKLTRMTKDMRSALHGVGLAFIMKNDYLNDVASSPFLQDVTEDHAESRAFKNAVHDMQSVCQDLNTACCNALADCCRRVDQMHDRSRSNINSLLWPFPRFFQHRLWGKNKNVADVAMPSVTTGQALQDALYTYDMYVKQLATADFLESLPRYGPLYLLFLYQYNLREHAANVKAMSEYLDELESVRTKRRLWWPKMGLRKWFQSPDMDPAMGDDYRDTHQPDETNNGLTLVRTSTRMELEGQEENTFRKHPSLRRYHDPDVTAPSSAFEWFFYGVHKVTKWFMTNDTLFAFKTALGVVMLAIPAWRAESAGWYFDWRGQWAMITLVLWMFPMPGLFIFNMTARVLGSVAGAVLGIVVWEITRGNPYALAVVCFIVFIPLYHIFLFNGTFRVAALMTKITMLLVVIYEYNFVLEGQPGYDRVWTVAGKRLLLVVIGLAACGILLMIPYISTGRVELRKRLARTIHDIARLYGLLTARIIETSSSKIPVEQRFKMFRKLAVDLRRQIEDERNLLSHAKFEPPLRGQFPLKDYQVIIEKVDNMADLVFSMGHAARHIKPLWRESIATALIRERKEYLSSVMTTLKLISTTLASKSAMPPYMISPEEARVRFARSLEQKINVRPEQIADIAFSSYSTFMMASSAFNSELQALLEAVQGLVGIEDYDFV
ncbi:uncharacterized protein BYT42DRAFT_509805 [Radiomyces spectabilis]|uniref:uncharacterized protein n=1 Tax=Radiomyces spectabilis TaxID=64574 RepID=UPI00221EE3DA|nr:uncharacterized protein BYT42DRAFT_509805 [Radiomyces spectabilis]KAI8391663.1 hypothetical protein BYT42DRAFT_509805 [Radiomyces spectabilis]